MLSTRRWPESERALQENTVLLARCYIRNRQDFRAVHVLNARKRWRRFVAVGGYLCVGGNRLSTRGRLLLAQATYRMDDLTQAEDVIVTALRAEIAEVRILLRQRRRRRACLFVQKYVRAEFHYLKGMICRNTNRVDDAIQCFADALECNPLLWPAFKELCQFGMAVLPPLMSLPTYIREESTHQEPLGKDQGCHEGSASRTGHL